MHKPAKNPLDTITGLVIVKTHSMWVFLKKLKPTAHCRWIWLFKFCTSLGLIMTNPLWAVYIAIPIHVSIVKMALNIVEPIM